MFRNHLVKAIPRLLLALWLAIGPAWAGSMTLLGVGKPAVGGASFALTYTVGGKGASSDTSLTTQSYGTLNYASGNTRVFAVVLWYAGGAINGLSVGGNSFSHVTTPRTAAVCSASNNCGDVWESTGPLAGTSGAVSVTYASAPSYTSAVALYSLTTTTPAPSDVQTGISAGTNTVAVSSALTVPSGGGAMVAASGNAGAGLTPVNWTSDITDATGGVNFTWGHTTATGSVTPSVNFAANDAGAITAVAVGP